MKRLLNYLPLLFLLACFPAHAINIYVSSQGSDNNNGTKEKPFGSLQAALFKARELRRINDPSIADGIHIILKGGVYLIYETLILRPEDAGTTSSPTVIEADGNEEPVLSGGVSISNWKKLVTSVPGLSAKAKGNIWVADVPEMNGNIFSFRQLLVNGRKAVRAKSVNGDQMDRIISWNKREQSCWIPTPKFPSISSAKGTEMFIHQWWAIAVLRIKKMEIHGDSTELFFQQPESRIQSEHPWPAPWISKETGNSPFYLTNAIQFLDEPGEWYLDAANKKIYYWPVEDENLSDASVIAPFTETLIKTEGNIDSPITNIYFKGISFEYTGWLRPSQQGHVPHQDGLYMTEAYKLKPAGTKEKPGLDNQAWIGRPAAAVEISFANSIRFNNCRFEHLGSTGLDMHLAVHNSFVEGNLFKDISGNGMLLGEYSDPATEIHLAYHPKDERVVCDSLTVSNNLITDVTNEDWSCVGIGAGYVRNTTIDHNEVENVSYSGISLGWGWNPLPNVMRNNKLFANRIHFYGKHNYDCSGIYTLSAQPGTVISENYIDSIYKAPYAHLPSHWFYLYTDEGSSYMTVKDNWTPSAKYLQNANGPGNVWENNGPQVKLSVKENAGLEKPYQYLLQEKTSALVHLPINEEHP
ncbi:MAG: right-handed parallel beta-helix repeat-containing protein, partial [Bacteroidetes bacterium]|nr:right-handed parallel beta-helix repeat-containing protein [Bacteroidota bacterium]